LRRQTREKNNEGVDPVGRGACEKKPESTMMQEWKSEEKASTVEAGPILGPSPWSQRGESTQKGGANVSSKKRWGVILEIAFLRTHRSFGLN